MSQHGLGLQDSPEPAITPVSSLELRAYMSVEQPNYREGPRIVCG